MNPSPGKTAALLMVVIAAMLGLVVGSVPLYRAFCQATGIGGPPRQVAAASERVAERWVKIRFDASVAKGLDWRFSPPVGEMRVRLGEDTLAVFTATNLSDRPVTGNAVFNATPDKIGRYVAKIQCFCFTEQELQPGQSLDMPVTFVIDPAMAEDPHAEEVSTITLSYTFFRANEPASIGRGRS
ncbi:cytochrome c oxidase assembly protein [Paramagnetospirillum kuznetsovii]|uniref:Cytochrome c oxidase assembly protein CtaG n=1 Tax=Paramagnetospirillum kuznetsovii TaxID=2053833 RepID=A0A364NZE7_9PROT|nr:cytochrome c oxidase assembly protein [Paramagnetospirillum kuznetsovii]RAU22458.1 cytochrome c oxidase assembly protein [Paramagnetospirillum kuznetsovii]